MQPLMIKRLKNFVELLNSNQMSSSIYALFKQ